VVVADEGLHIWHAYFGLLGANNDLIVLDRSPLIENMLTSDACDFKFTTNGYEYDRNYLLTDEIYHHWSCFVSTIHMPPNGKRSHFAKFQEAARKDVERCFGVLQARFAIVRNPASQWSMDFITDIMFACYTLHNMILAEEEVHGLLGEGTGRLLETT
jgi:hypothetical protein